MIYSMTGFAKVSRNINGYEHTFEIKTLNHKYVDIKLALDRALDACEHEISEYLRSEIKRGSVRAVYTIKQGGTSALKSKLFDVDIDAAKSYHDAYLKVSKILNMNYIPDVSVIMRHSGVLNPVEDDNFEDMESVMGVVADGVRELDKFRTGEGKRLAKFISDRLKLLKKFIQDIAGLAGGVKEIYFNKMVERIADFRKKTNIDIDESRILQEVAVMADRADISEEIERFGSHIKYFEKLLKGDEKDAIAGRKMDFLCQELFREITTISNKTSLTDITRVAIEAKSEIEKIREQVQNIQ